MCVASIGRGRLVDERGPEGFAVERADVDQRQAKTGATKTERGSPLGLWPVVGRQARGLRRGDRQSPPAPDLEWTFAVPPVHPLFILPLPPITCVYWPSPNTPPITAPNAVIALPVMHGAGGTPVPHRR